MSIKNESCDTEKKLKNKGVSDLFFFLIKQ